MFNPLRKLFSLIGSLVLLALGLYTASLVYVLSFANEPNIPERADAALVLGAKVNLDGTPSHPLYYRTLDAVKLYNEEKIDFILLTGGVGLGPEPESEIARIIAIQNGVPAEKIIIEDKSHNTFESIKQVKKGSDEYKIKSVIVVSDRFHVARGVLVARNFGYDPVYWSYPDLRYMSKKLIIQNYIREGFAMLSYLPKVIIE